MYILKICLLVKCLVFNYTSFPASRGRNLLMGALVLYKRFNKNYLFIFLKIRNFLNDWSLFFFFWLANFISMTWVGCCFIQDSSLFRQDLRKKRKKENHLSHVKAFKTTLPVHVTILILECEPKSLSIYLLYCYWIQPDLHMEECLVVFCFGFKNKQKGKLKTKQNKHDVRSALHIHIPFKM